jgi:glycosyltransferase involved in cell wall biosynthesis
MNLTQESKRSNTAVTLGVVAISYNEQVDLPGFLSHLVDWVDEIVIIDDGSGDSTAAIASEYGSKVKFIQSKRGEGEYYADQRNKGIDAAESDWLLHMDIDERVTPKLAAEILDTIRSGNYDACKFRRLNYFMHRPMKGGGWADWNLVHLARRPLLRFGGMYHESIHLKAEASRIGQLTNKMHHFNDASYAERLRKSLTYQEEVVSDLRDKGVKVNLFRMIYASSREFLVKYLYKKGITDGTAGFISAIHSTFAIFKAYALLWEEQHRISREDLEEEMKEKWNNKDN